MGFYESDTYREDLTVAARNSIGIEQLHGKKILITGATGTIGSFLTDTVLAYNESKQADISIYIAGRSPEKMRDIFAKYIFIPQVQCLKYDILQPITFDMPVDYVIHAGGNAHPAAFHADPVGTVMGSVEGTHRLLQYAKQHGAKRFLYISSGEVYSDLDSMSVRSCYPIGKRAAENLCAAYNSQYGLETVVVRLCHTFGPTMTREDNRATVQFFRNAVNGEDIVLKSAGTQRRSYCYVADSASAILTTLFKGESGEAYDSANPDFVVTIAELAHLIAEIAGVHVVFENPTQTEILQQSPIKSQVLNSEKLERLGWMGKYDARYGIENMLKILTEYKE